MYDWFVGLTKAFRLVGKSAPGGYEYGAVVSYSGSIIKLENAWIDNTDVTNVSIMTIAYR